MSEHGVWLYAVTGGSSGEAPRVPVGVAGEPVRGLEADGLTAVVGTVDLRYFGEEALRRNLEDLDWLATAARAHDRVIAALAGLGPTVPIGFATVFTGEDNVRALLDERRADLAGALDRLTGRTEWGVKAYAAAKPRPPAGGGGNSGGGAGEDGGAGVGAAYLKRRRADLAAQESAATSAAQRADRIFAGLAEVSEGAHRYPPQAAELSGRRERMLLNAAYLVDDERLAAFRSAVSDLDDVARRDGVHVELTGPWPAYSFTAGLADG